MRVIGGTARSRLIEAPKGRDTRPTLDRVRENLFNILAPRVPDSRVLDLFAGSGSLSLEALSRGASFAVLCDHDRSAAAVEKKNLDTLGMTRRARVMHMSWQQAVSILASEEQHFDLIFLDPPYAMRDLTQVTEQILPLMSEDALVILEHQGNLLPLVSAELVRTDQRRYGYCGLLFFQHLSREV